MAVIPSSPLLLKVRLNSPPINKSVHKVSPEVRRSFDGWVTCPARPGKVKYLQQLPGWRLVKKKGGRVAEGSSGRSCIHTHERGETDVMDNVNTDWARVWAVSGNQHFDKLVFRAGFGLILFTRGAQRDKSQSLCGLYSLRSVSHERLRVKSAGGTRERLESKWLSLPLKKKLIYFIVYQKNKSTIFYPVLKHLWASNSQEMRDSGQRMFQQREEMKQVIWGYRTKH